MIRSDHSEIICKNKSNTGYFEDGKSFFYTLLKFAYLGLPT